MKRAAVWEPPGPWYVPARRLLGAPRQRVHIAGEAAALVDQPRPCSSGHGLDLLGPDRCLQPLRSTTLPQRSVLRSGTVCMRPSLKRRRPAGNGDASVARFPVRCPKTPETWQWSDGNGQLLVGPTNRSVGALREPPPFGLAGSDPPREREKERKDTSALSRNGLSQK